MNVSPRLISSRNIKKLSISLALDLQPHSRTRRRLRDVRRGRAGQLLGLSGDRARRARAGGEIHRQVDRMFHFVLSISRHRGSSVSFA
jgi:hypothetical protein